MLDEAGLPHARIFASGGLDETRWTRSCAPARRRRVRGRHTDGRVGRRAVRRFGLQAGRVRGAAVLKLSAGKATAPGASRCGAAPTATSSRSATRRRRRAAAAAGAGDARAAPDRATRRRSTTMRAHSTPTSRRCPQGAPADASRAGRGVATRTRSGAHRAHARGGARALRRRLTDALRGRQPGRALRLVRRDLVLRCAA